MKLKLDCGTLTFTRTGFRIGKGRVANTPEKVRDALASMSKGERRKIRKTLFRRGLHDLARS